MEFTNCSDVPRTVKNALNLAYENLYLIVNCDDALSTLAHGDYWIPNFIVDNKTMSLKGIIDPFNVSWTELNMSYLPLRWALVRICTFMIFIKVRSKRQNIAI